jgi:hypothetical protein
MFSRAAFVACLSLVLGISGIACEASAVQASRARTFCNQYATYTDYIYYNVPNPNNPSQVDKVTVTYTYNSSYSCGASRFFAALSTGLTSTSTQWGSLHWSRSGVGDGIAGDTIPALTTCPGTSYQSNSYGLPASGNFSGTKFLPSPPTPNADLTTTFAVSDPCTTHQYLNYFYSGELQPA